MPVGGNPEVLRQINFSFQVAIQYAQKMLDSYSPAFLAESIEVRLHKKLDRYGVLTTQSREAIRANVRMALGLWPWRQVADYGCVVCYMGGRLLAATLESDQDEPPKNEDFLDVTSCRNEEFHAAVNRVLGFAVPSVDRRQYVDLSSAGRVS